MRRPRADLTDDELNRVIPRLQQDAISVSLPRAQTVGGMGIEVPASMGLSNARRTHSRAPRADGASASDDG